MSKRANSNKIQEFSTACPRNCYSTCSLKVRVQDGKVIGIDPHSGNQATPEGPCIKGLAYVERANSEDRILTPLKRTSNGFEKITWEDALNTISSKLKHYKEKHGPHSVLFFAASGMSGLLNGVSSSFWKLFGGATTTYGNLCWPAGLEASRLTLGANNHNAPWDLVNAKLVVLWGKNPAESNIQEMMHLEKSLENGGQLLVVDPRRTPSAERANFLVQIKPGTDGALALGIARELIHNEWIDKEFIENNVLGFDEFKAHVEKYDLQKVSDICRVPIEGIKKIAKIIGTVKPMTLIPGYGMQRYANGGQSIRCILALSVLTGNIGKPGACWHYANLQSYIFDDIKEPESYYPGGEDKCFRRKISMAKLGADILQIKDPQIKMIWVERGNPLTQNPNSSQNQQAFRSAEFRVVVDQFMTDTCLEADIILPAKNMFEQSDIIGSYWNPYIQLKPKVVEPAGEVKPETEIYYLLAQKLGFDPEAIEDILPKPDDESIKEYLLKFLAKFPELSWEELEKGPQLAGVYEEIPFADSVFPTPSGKIELLSIEASQKWGVSELPDYVPLTDRPEKYPLQLLSPNTKNRIHSQFGNLKIIKQFEREAVLFMHPEDAFNRDIEDQEDVLVLNSLNYSNVKLQFDYGLRKGAVVLTNGHWHCNGASPNSFTDGRETDMGHGTAFHDTWVEVKKI